MDALPTYLEMYKRSPLGQYLRAMKVAGSNATMIEAVQPPGDMSDAPSRDLVLIEIVSAGLHHQCDFGAGRFEGRSPVGSLFLVAPEVATQIDVRCEHTIRVVGIDQELAKHSLPDAAAGLDFGHLHSGHFQNAAVLSLMHGLWRSAESATQSGRLYADGVLSLVVSELAQQARKPRAMQKGGLAPWQIRRVTEAIGDCRDDALSLQDLADMTRLSLFHFARAFRTSLGVAPHRYQMMLRIDRARSLLEKSELSVTDIALEVGYQSSQALARAFRQETGRSPGDYRRERRA